MQLHSPLSPTARPFQPGATSLLTLVDDTPQDGLTQNSPPWGSTRGLPVRETTPNHHYTSDDDGAPLIPPSLTGPLTGGVEAEEVKVTRVVVTLMKLAPPEGGKRKRMDFLVRSKFLNLKVRRVILMTWPMPLGSGPIVSLTTVNIMGILTSCP